MRKTRDLKVAVCGIPRGYQFPLPDGNWLRPEHKERIHAIAPCIELIEIPAHRVKNVNGIEVLLAEGGNRVHYEGELDWEEYQRFFTPDLKWVQLCSTGFSDNITPQILDESVTLTNAPGLHTHPIAESVIAAMLNHAKRLRQRGIDQKNHLWRHLDCGELTHGTVLMIGLGRIGRQTAWLCKAFGMRVVGTKRRLEPVPHVDVVFPVDELARYLPEADYVVVLAPLTPETESLLEEKAFEKMNPSAYLINLGRGKIVHESAMMAALKDRRIAGAYLDCFAEEPLPEMHELWDMPNVFVAPHDSHSSPYIGDRMVDIFCDNLKRYVTGKRLDHICDPVKGY